MPGLISGGAKLSKRLLSLDELEAKPQHSRMLFTGLLSIFMI